MSGLTTGLRIATAIGIEHWRHASDRCRCAFRSSDPGAISNRIWNPTRRANTHSLRLSKRHTSTAVGVFLAALRYSPDVSTQKVDDLVQSMGMTGISKSQVSRLCSELDEQVKTFLERPVSGDWAYVWFDATYVKSRNGGRVVSRAIAVAVGVSAEGRREVLGIAVGLVAIRAYCCSTVRPRPAETEAFGMEFLRSLVARGLTGVRLVISDVHIGLKNAIQQVLGANWQRCRAYFVGQPRTTAKRGTLRRFMTFPKEKWRQISSTSPLERINTETKRRTNVVGIFPNDRAITRLVGALVNERSNEWQVTRKYMSQGSLQKALNPVPEQQRLSAEGTDKVA